MSPEQVRHEKLDTRTDLFSFGLVLYEMAAAKRAFTGPTVVDVHEAVLHETPVPARVRNPMLPRGFDALLAKALEKDRVQRYQSATALKNDLERIVRDANPARKRVRQATAAVTLLALVAVGVWRYDVYRHRITLAPTDTIVLADADNQTSDPVFDDALNISLRYEMQQTPYLNILGIDKASATLAQLKLPSTTKITPDVARQICGRTNSKMVIAQSIADAGNGYLLEMRALDCGSGQPWARSSPISVAGMKSFTSWESHQYTFARSWENPPIRWRASISRWKRRSALRSKLCRPALRGPNSTSPATWQERSNSISEPSNSIQILP
jgi:serine/threonine protein kinase